MTLVCIVRYQAEEELAFCVGRSVVSLNGTLGRFYTANVVPLLVGWLLNAALELRFCWFELMIANVTSPSLFFFPLTAALSSDSSSLLYSLYFFSIKYTRERWGGFPDEGLR